MKIDFFNFSELTNFELVCEYDIENLIIEKCQY